MLSNVNWLHATLLTSTPIIAIYGVFTTPVIPATVVLTVIAYFLTGWGITAGYHRLYAHRAYTASYPVRLALCLFGAAAFQGSAKWWCRLHRIHHRFTDTSKDPYNATRGFWYSHVGWMLQRQDVKKLGTADVTDLVKDPMLIWQHRHYGKIAIGVGIVLPTMIAGLGWGDYRGGFFFASILRMVAVHHATFFVNSLAHWLGEKTFTDQITAYDSFVTAILTLGEGYHNFHHEFPNDYRNGIRWWQYDPTKWLIRTLATFGLTTGLKRHPSIEVTKAKLQQRRKRIQERKARLAFGQSLDSLPTMSRAEYVERCETGENLLVIDNFVHDVEDFVHEHPGGRQTLLMAVGQPDATPLFTAQHTLSDGTKHTHTPEAWSQMTVLRVARLVE